MTQQNAIQVQGLCYGYDESWGLNGVSFNVPRGSVYGFLGPNGSGKSTTIQLLMGFLESQAGSVDVLGLDPRRQPVDLKRSVGYISERQSFYDWMRVDELMAFVAHYRQEWDAAFAEHLRQRFGLDPRRPVGRLSKGEQAMVALLLALAFRPPLLIFDEPTSALDPGARRRFFEGVLAEYQEDGGTVFVSSHLIHEIAGLVDNVGILARGELLSSRTVEQFYNDIRRYRLSFTEAPVGEWDLPGQLTAIQDGRQVVVTIDLSLAKEAEVQAALGSRRPFRIEEEKMTLEEIFLAVVDGGSADG